MPQAIFFENRVSLAEIAKTPHACVVSSASTEIRLYSKQKRKAVRATIGNRGRRRG